MCLNNLGDIEKNQCPKPIQYEWKVKGNRLYRDNIFYALILESYSNDKETMLKIKLFHKTNRYINGTETFVVVSK